MMAVQLSVLYFTVSVGVGYALLKLISQDEDTYLKVKNNKCNNSIYRDIILSDISCWPLPVRLFNLQTFECNE